MKGGNLEGKGKDTAGKSSVPGAPGNPAGDPSDDTPPPPQKGKSSGKPLGKGKGKTGSRQGKGKKGGKGAPGGDPDGDDGDDDDGGGPGRPGANREPWEHFESSEWSFLDSLDLKAEFLKPCPTLRKVPPRLTKKVAARFGCASHHALEAGNAIARDRALKYFFLLGS